MPESRTPAIQVDYRCDQCGRPVRYTGRSVMVAPPSFIHECPDAADRADFNSVLWLKLEGEADEQTPLATLRIAAKGPGKKRARQLNSDSCRKYSPARPFSAAVISFTA